MSTLVSQDDCRIWEFQGVFHINVFVVIAILFHSLIVGAFFLFLSILFFFLEGMLEDELIMKQSEQSPRMKRPSPHINEVPNIVFLSLGLGRHCIIIGQ